jgi:hypothetical protein
VSWKGKRKINSAEEVRKHDESFRFVNFDISESNSNGKSTNSRSENEIESIDEGVVGDAAMPCCKRKYFSFERRESQRMVSQTFRGPVLTELIGMGTFWEQKIVIGKAL